MNPTPESTGKWLGLILPILQQGGPILTLFLLLVSAVGGWYLMHALQRSRDANKELYERMLVCMQTQATLGQRCYGAGPK